MNNTLSTASNEYASLIHSLKRGAVNDFWEGMLASHSFFPPMLIEPTIKLALAKMGAPVDDRLREQLKVSFNSSRFALGFYNDSEVSDNLPKFIEYEATGLEERLPKLKVKQKFKDFIT